MRVFADTSALYALLVRTDSAHAEVLRTFRHLLADGHEFTTTTYVTVETAALLQHRLGLDPVRDLVDRIFPLIQVRSVSLDLHERGFARLLRENRREWSLVDCTSFEFMKSEGLTLALAVDPDFEEAGFQVLPPGRA